MNQIEVVDWFFRFHHLQIYALRWRLLYSKAYFEKYVYVPEVDDLDRVVEDYTRMGFPGCVGFMDVTHIMWKQCPSSLRHVCTGRYHCPSVAFQMVSDHTHRIHHVSRPFYGATNDITITYNDSYPRDVMLGNVHVDRLFSTYDLEGGLTYWSGAYLKCDGGYPKCVCFVDPALTDYEYHSVVWTELLESVRKDIERLFGALKQRPLCGISSYILILLALVCGSLQYYITGY